MAKSLKTQNKILQENGVECSSSSSLSHSNSVTKSSQTLDHDNNNDKDKCGQAAATREESESCKKEEMKHLVSSAAAIVSSDWNQINFTRGNKMTIITSVTSSKKKNYGS